MSVDDCFRCAVGVGVDLETRAEMMDPKDKSTGRDTAMDIQPG
jgi:hypothetical protein